jgi:hypothetical protein
MNVTRKRVIQASLALILITGAIQTPSVQADTMVLTENSSTNLTATLDGTSLTVDTLSSDHWEVHLPAGDFVTGVPAPVWREPENPLVGNRVDISFGFTFFVIDSEVQIRTPNPVNNGSSVSFPNLLSTPSGLHDLTVVFNDNGDVAVPEPSTLSYMILTAFVSAICFRRKLRTPLRRGSKNFTQKIQNGVCAVSRARGYSRTEQRASETLRFGFQ